MGPLQLKLAILRHLSWMVQKEVLEQIESKDQYISSQLLQSLRSRTVQSLCDGCLTRCKFKGFSLGLEQDYAPNPKVRKDTVLIGMVLTDCDIYFMF